tara:strand:+ start:1459 stop:1788 length:330 start_codon:yes stop_codon:yes gene_type:complete
MKTTENQKAKGDCSPPVCSPDRIGWWALRHRDGWWVGTDKGVNCYEDHDFARVALTILWQREGGRVVNYRIERFTGANVIAGEFTPQKSGEQAIRDYEANKVITHSREI